MNNELIKINDDGLVSARDLHEFLGLSKRFSAWFETYTKNEDYGFTENEDFTSVLSSTVVNNGAKRELQDYAITIDMAKELSMLSKSERGKQARKYFIQIEKAWNSPEMIMKRALEIANRQVENLKLENAQQKQIIGELKPKADYTDLILKSKSIVAVTQIAKDYGMSAQEMNNMLHKLKVQYLVGKQWILYAKYQSKGYTHSETIPIKHKDGRSDVNMITKWTQKGRLFLYDLLKENGVLPMIEREVS